MQNAGKADLEKTKTLNKPQKHSDQQLLKTRVTANQIKSPPQ